MVMVGEMFPLPPIAWQMAGEIFGQDAQPRCRKPAIFFHKIQLKMKPRSIAATAMLAFCIALAATLSAKNTPNLTHSASALRLEEFGIASYYAEAFHGKKTANGEKYDMRDLTCAHKSLPFGTLVRVTRLDNGQYITVRVNDRGPYTKGFIIDLSKRAAEKIGLIQAGTAKVKIEVVGNTSSKDYSGEPVMYSNDEKPYVAKPASLPIPTERAELKPMPTSKPAKLEAKKVTKVEPLEREKPEIKAFEKVTAKSFKTYDLYKIELSRPQKAGFGIQVETLSNAENVFATVAKLQSSYENILMSIEPGKDDKPVYKLIVGPYADKAKADAAQKSLKKKGYKGFVISLEADKK